MSPTSPETLREHMVASQIAGRGVTSPRVLGAMRRVPRHLFVPRPEQGQAYEDHPVPIGFGQTISQPYMVGAMTEWLDLAADERVLEIGTGSGYQAAVLSLLVREVITIERHPELARQAAERLRGLGYDNVSVITGDGTLGHAEGAPYDAILVTAGSPAVPEQLPGQLAVGGRLVCPAGGRDCQRLIKITRTARGFEETKGFACLFVPLIGAQGWSEDTT